MKKLYLPIFFVVIVLVGGAFSLLPKVFAQDDHDVSDLQADINDGQNNQAADEQAALDQSEDDSQVQEGDGQNPVVTENTSADVPTEIQTEKKDDELPAPQQTTEQSSSPDSSSQPDLGQDVSGQTPDTGAQPVDNSAPPAPSSSEQQSAPSDTTPPPAPPASDNTKAPNDQQSPPPSDNVQPQTPSPSPEPSPSPDNGPDQVQGAATRLSIFQQLLYFLFGRR